LYFVSLCVFNTVMSACSVIRFGWYSSFWRSRKNLWESSAGSDTGHTKNQRILSQCVRSYSPRC